MRAVRFVLVFALLSACGAAPENKEPEADSFYETYHLTGPVDDALRPCVVGSKA